MPREDYYDTDGSETLLAPDRGPEASVPRIIRRAVLECITHMVPWVQEKDPITKKMVMETQKRPSLYEAGNGWRGLLEEFCGLRIEILGLTKELDLGGIAAGKPSPATNRFKELGSSADQTLLLAWHQGSGLIALASAPETAELTVTRALRIPWDEQENSQEEIWLWHWDRKILRRKDR